MSYSKLVDPAKRSFFINRVQPILRADTSLDAAVVARLLGQAFAVANSLRHLTQTAGIVKCTDTVFSNTRLINAADTEVVAMMQANRAKVKECIRLMILDMVAESKKA